MRKTAHEWVAEDILSIEIGPWNTSSRLESKLRVQPLRGLLLPQHIPDADRDLDAEAVAGIPDSASETESQKGGGVGNQSQPYSPSSFGGEGRRQEQVAIDVPEEQGGQASSSLSLDASTLPFAHKLQTQWTLMLNPPEVQNTGARKQHSKERERQSDLMTPVEDPRPK